MLQKITASEPCGRQAARYLEAFVPEKNHSLKAALFRNHVKQFNEMSCSVATVVTVVNAVREFQGGRSEPITQMDILEKVCTGHWKERMSPGGYNGRHGLPLPLLGKIVKNSFEDYRLAYKTIETIQGAKDRFQVQKQKQKLRQRLVEFETQDNRLILAHFDQGAFVNTPSVPHISPVGRFDIQTGEVTILDVDPEQDGPYEVPFATFCKGLFSSYHPVLRPFGYQAGGYVWVTLS